MANSIKKPLKDGAWVELTSGASPTGLFSFSNIGTVSVFVQYATASPAATARGDLYKPSEGDRPALSGGVRAWARVEQIDLGDAEVYVTEA